MRDHLKASYEVQIALKEVNSSMKKKQTKMIFIWVNVFIKCLLLPIALLLLDALPDIMLVESYRHDWHESRLWNKTMHNQNFDTCTMDKCSSNMKFVCYPYKLERFPKFVYGLIFVLSPWIFYFSEYLHSEHFHQFQEVSSFIITSRNIHSDKKVPGFGAEEGDTEQICQVSVSSPLERSCSGGLLARVLLLQAVLAQGALLDQLRQEEDRKKRDLQPQHNISVPSPD